MSATEHNEYDDEIDLLALLGFLVDNAWRIALGGAIGVCLAVACWFGLVQYQAQIILVNQGTSNQGTSNQGTSNQGTSNQGTSNQGTSNQGAISFIGWKTLSKSLPSLAEQWLDKNKVAPPDQAQFKRMSQDRWWQQNVKPTLSLSKADTKELAAMSKQMTESGGDNILNFVITAKSGTQQEAAANASIAVRFMQQGVAYLSLQTLVSGYETTVLNTGPDLAKRIVQTRIELKYQQERARNLERLRDRFPGNTGVVNQQVVDLTDSNAKYMPISTQLVAVQTEINTNLEQLERMKDQLARTQVLEAFVAQAKPLVAQEFNGLALADQLLAIEKTLRGQADPQDINTLQALNALLADIVTQKTFFSKGLEVRLAPTVEKASGVIAPAALGLVLGLLLAIATAAWPLLRAKLRPAVV